MTAPFVDRMAPIEETVDNPTSNNMAEQLDPGYKIVKVAEANPKRQNVLNKVISFLTMAVSTMLFPPLHFLQLTEIITYLSLLVGTAATSGAGISPKLFALSQVIDMLPNIIDEMLAVVKFFYPPKSGKQDRNIYIVEGDGLPGIDFIVTTCKEPVDVILDTVKAILDLDYPKGKLRVIVSDDGRDPALKAALAPLGHIFSNLMYFTRTPDPNKYHGGKAGNMNATLRMLEKEDLEPNPWVANVDCDMIPDREMLRVLMAQALKDKTVGLVTLPQDFYNIPVNDPLHENMVITHQRDQMARDEYDAAWCPGSGFVFRRQAWKEVGGFAEFSMCDDVFFGWCLNGAGYKTIAVNACHQTGMQPDSFQDHMKQRRRWYIGNLRNYKHLRCGLGQPVFANMTTMQYLIAFNQLQKPPMTTLKGITVILNMVCLCFGIVYQEPVVNVGTDKVARILYAYAFHKVASLIFDGYSALTYGHNVRRRAIAIVWHGLHFIKAAIDEELPTWLGGGRLGFSVTGQKGDTLVLEERDAATRPSTLIRLSIANQTERVLWHLVYFLVVMGLTIWNIHHIVWAARSLGIMWFWLITGPLFPGLKLEHIFIHLSPVWYFIKPPTMPDRKDLMYLDERTGGYRPKREYRGVRFTKSMWTWELLNIASAVWSVFAFWQMNGGFAGTSSDLAQGVLDATPVLLVLVATLAVVVNFSFAGVVAKRPQEPVAENDHKAEVSSNDTNKA